MSLDLKLTQDGDLGIFDISISPSGDFEGTEGLETTVLVSLLTDRRAEESQIPNPKFRGGWLGDVEPIIEGYEIGSHLWLTDSGKARLSTVNQDVEHSREALQHLVDQAIAADVEVSGELTGPGAAELKIDITAPDGSVSTEFLDLWKKTAFVATELPAPIVDLPPFAPTSVAGIVAWADAAESDHTVDDTCGVEVATDAANNFDYFQTNAARRPKLFRGANGWFYRFDGVDDFLATINGTFQSFREGTVFMVYKPTAGVAGRDFLAFGSNGFAAQTLGLAFSQTGAQTIAIQGANGTLDASVTGPASNDAPVGVVFRWGPDTDGADVETSAGELDDDPSYTGNIPVINQVVLGAGFDGTDPDVARAAAFESNVLAFYARRVSDADVLDLLEYAGTRIFSSSVGEPFDDCFFFDDDFGLT